jgi:hypothetical protein
MRKKMTKRYGGSVGGKQTKRKSHKYLRKKHRATKRAYRRRHKRVKSIRAKRRTRVNKIRNMHGGVVGWKGALLTSALTGAAGAGVDPTEAHMAAAEIYPSGNKASRLDGAIDKAAGPSSGPSSGPPTAPWAGPLPVSGPWANLGMNKENPTAKPPSTEEEEDALSKRRNQGKGQGEELRDGLHGKLGWEDLMTPGL